MSDFSTADSQWMRRAIELAKHGNYTCMPNPRVGCVITHHNNAVGEGWHIKAGEGHAEVNALKNAQDKARNATAYVTLEPCSHFGRTPPCAKALIKAGITRVVVAMEDPNPLVAGKGIAMLREAGISVHCGLMASEAKQLNAGFLSRISGGLPQVRAKLAMSLDGRTAMASGESQWITGTEARQSVQLLRAESSAIITGIGSILHDNSSLTVRPDEMPSMEQGWPSIQQICQTQPLRVVLDSHLQTPADAKVIQGSGHCLIITTETAHLNKIQQLEQAGAEIFIQPQAQGHIHLRSVLEELARRQCNDVLVESGATLAGAFLQAQLLDQLIIFMAPILMGSQARPLMTLPLSKMADKYALNIQGICPVGRDWRIIATPATITDGHTTT
ncbi:Riboflavin biosynthesis protein RibD [invertebrate metagenome]|uniref:Riboflavin biosynthesis protein RibD n=1 Tax=invertebrate metagenome TaxID=1711999 RepID=A0A2H9T448_9ZZZZ